MLYSTQRGSRTADALHLNPSCPKTVRLTEVVTPKSPHFRARSPAPRTTSPKHTRIIHHPRAHSLGISLIGLESAANVRSSDARRRPAGDGRGLPQVREGGIARDGARRDARGVPGSRDAPGSASRPCEPRPRPLAAPGAAFIAPACCSWHNRPADLARGTDAPSRVGPRRSAENLSHLRGPGAPSRSRRRADAALRRRSRRAGCAPAVGRPAAGLVPVGVSSHRLVRAEYKAPHAPEDVHVKKTWKDYGWRDPHWEKFGGASAWSVETETFHTYK